MILNNREFVEQLSSFQLLGRDSMYDSYFKEKIHRDWQDN
jgi:hypothetical protein